MIKIGVTGKLCAGKDTLAEYLKEKGFEHISLSDMIREECRKRGLEVTLQNLIRLGNELRKKEGSDILAKMAVEKMKEGNNYVVTSIRNPLEVKYLSNSKNFVLINIESPLEKRFERMIKRGKKESEPKSLEEFKRIEESQLSSTNESDQQIKNCIDMARLTIVNDADITLFLQKVEENFLRIKEMASFVRPGWDEYFVGLMKSVGKRGTCDRGRSGCVIVKDKRIMATGYVGSPPGLAHCDDVGHWFKKVIHEDGSITQHCIRTVHSEANAIAQAAKNGINIEGSTLYCKLEPCLDCTKLLISAGIKRIIAEKKYHASKESREMLEEAGVALEVLDDEFEGYESDDS
ncbi:MAG: AAA family ATPase [Nanoarchaeota archaeon]|nr:AAA family ATPase [Nanoarchaeota archaeon]